VLEKGIVSIYGTKFANSPAFISHSKPVDIVISLSTNEIVPTLVNLSSLLLPAADFISKLKK